MAVNISGGWTLARYVAGIPFSWFFRLKIPDLADRFLMSVDDPGVCGWSVYLLGGALKGEQKRAGVGSDIATATATPTTGSWTSVFFYSEHQFFQNIGVNGGNIGTNVAGGSLNGTPTRTLIGSFSNAADVCDFAVWRSVRSAGEYAAMHAGDSPKLFAPDDLVFYAPLPGDESPARCILNGDLTLDSGTPTLVDHPMVIRPRRRAVYAFLDYQVPVTDFVMDVTTGPSPIVVSGYDQSTLGPAQSWNWERRLTGGSYSTFATTKNTGPQTFTDGQWDVKLTATNVAGSHAREYLGIVNVGAPNPPSSASSAMGLGMSI